MRAVSRCAIVAALGLTAGTLAQQGTGAAQARPRTPAAQRPAQAPPRRAPAQPRREAAVPFKVGETLTYDVSWSQYLVAGSATARVAEKRPSYGSTAYYLVAEGRPLPIIQRFYSVYYKMDALLDTFGLLSQRTSLYAEEGTSKRYSSTRFDRSARRAQSEFQADTTFKDDFAIPPGVQDGLSTLYTLRARALKAGDRFTVPVADEGTLYSVTFDVSGPEPLRVPLGEFTAWNLRITILDSSNQPAGKNIAAWISTDPRRLPLKLQADLPVGNFILALRTAQ
jgi:hypothetical protein